MKNIINIIIVVLLFFSLTGCSNKENSHNEILYWCSNNTDEINFAKLITEKWSKEHSDKKIKFQPVPEGRSSEEIILAAVVGNTTPGIYSNMWQ